MDEMERLGGLMASGGKQDKNLPPEKGLPSDISCEKFVLGSLLLDGDRMNEIAERLSENDFCMQKHRVIWARMIDVWSSGERVDRVMVATELRRRGELDMVDGLSYLISLDNEMPHIANLDGYIRVLKDKSALRDGAKLVALAMTRFMSDSEPADKIVPDLQDAISELYLRLSTKQQTDFTTPLAAVEKYEGGINAFLDPTKRAKGVTTGFTKFDEMTGGLHAGDYAILAARPSQGKTALALNIAWHVAHKLKLPVPFFSLEMSVESLVTRMVCSIARVDSQRFRAGYINQDERTRLRIALESVTQSPLFIDDNTGITMATVASKLRRLKAQYGEIGLAVFDYLQLLGDNKAENRNQEVTRFSRGFKLLAKELNCPFLVLSQLSRATEIRKGGGNRPQLSDLRESGAIEQDADIVGFIFRAETYDRSREELRGLAELILAKQRNGPVGTIPLVFIHSQTRFDNPTDEGDEPQ